MFVLLFIEKIATHLQIIVAAFGKTTAKKITEIFYLYGNVNFV